MLPMTSECRPSLMNMNLNDLWSRPRLHHVHAAFAAFSLVRGQILHTR
jgi:hypothetical protein